MRRPRTPLRRVAQASAIVAVAAVASAHEGGVLDLEPIEEHVADALPAATGEARQAYVAIDRILGRPRTGDLADDLATLARACRAARPLQPVDAALVELIRTALDAGDAKVAGESDDVAALVRLLERAADRRRVERLAGRAVRTLDAARERDAAGDVAGCAARLHRTAVTFADALRSGQRLVTRQARRGAPGQPIARGASGTIDTYAGTGAAGAGFEGAPARAAPFYFPFDVAADPSTGLVHVVDSNTHRIRRIDPDGRVRTAAGSGLLGDTTGPALTARLHHPSSVAWDPATGDLLICGWHSARMLRLVVSTGRIEYAGGSGELGFSGDGGPAVDAEFDYPSGAVFLADGTWIVSDAGNLRIRAVDGATGEIDTIAGTGGRGFLGDDGPAADAEFDFPAGESEGPVGRVALDPSQTLLYVADTANRRIRRIDLASGTIATFAGNGESGWSGDDGPALAGSFVTPVDVDCDGAGNVFVCDRGSSTVRRIDVVTGALSTVAGSGEPGYAGDGGPATAARLDAPQGIHVDRVRGRIYVADTLNNVVRVVWE